MASFPLRLKTWWTTADRNQRVVTLGGIGALLLLLVGSAFFVTRPHYVTLLDGLSEADKSAVVSTLETAGFKPNIDRQGAVEIAEGDKAKAQLALAKAGTIPKGSHHWGQNDLTKAGPFTSPEVERETLNSILQGEIATTLEGMEGVASATVLITNPKQSVFAEDQRSPSASVTVTEKAPGTLTRENGRTIATLVCSAVDGMKPKDVVVVNDSLAVLWDGSDMGGGGTKPELDKKVARDWESKLQSALDVAFGAGSTKVIVSADVDTDKSTTKLLERTTAPKPNVVRNEKESMDGGRKIAGGATGAVANTDDAAKALAAAGGGEKSQKYVKDGTQKEYPTNEMEKVTEEGAGKLKGLSISIIANSDKVTDATQVESIVRGVMGGKIQVDANGAIMPNQAFTTAVTSVKFDGTAALAAKEAADRVASQQRTQQILSLLPIAAILMVALLVAKQVGKISRAVLPVATDPVAAFAEEVPGALPGAEGFDALPVRAGFEGEETEESIELERFKAQVDVPLESLKQMASERPEMVATLIKSMMLGERSK